MQLQSCPLCFFPIINAPFSSGHESFLNVILHHLLSAQKLLQLNNHIGLLFLPLEITHVIFLIWHTGTFSCERVHFDRSVDDRTVLSVPILIFFFLTYYLLYVFPHCSIKI